MSLPTARFAGLFQGLPSSFGTGAGGWVHRAPTLDDFSSHLAGRGKGIGIAPLRDDGTVLFAAIDLDEPDFEAARTMAQFLPSRAFIERSRSGNAHVWVFFLAPIEAWVVRGILREATAAIGKPGVEVFPKQDRLRLGMVGNYINLPYHGFERPILDFDRVVAPGSDEGHRYWEYNVNDFVDLASANFADPDAWRKRASWLGVPSPEERAANTPQREFGTSDFLHICAEHVIANRDSNPVIEGFRAVVYFNLAKQLANCVQFDSDEALGLMALVNDASPDPISEGELKRIYFNAERGRFTSTGCDDPLFLDYAHPDCKIAHGSL